MWNENTITALIHLKADEYGLSPSKARQMVATVRCESQFKTNAIGDGGKSWGLSQIHSPSWPMVSQDEAFDPNFAIDFMAQKFSIGKERLWTCWRILYLG